MVVMLGEKGLGQVVIVAHNMKCFEVFVQVVYIAYYLGNLWYSYFLLINATNERKRSNVLWVIKIPCELIGGICCADMLVLLRWLVCCLERYVPT